MSELLHDRVVLVTGGGSGLGAAICRELHALHAELRPYGIKVTAVIVGGMKTPFLLDRFPDIDVSTLQDPTVVARAVCFVVRQPEETVIPEIMVLPMRETSWP